MFPLKGIKGTPKDDDDDICLQDHDQQKRDEDDDDDDSPACQQSDPPPGEAPQGGQHHPATDRGHGEVLTRELPGDSRPQPDSPPKTSDSPWDGQEEWVDHTQGKRGGYYQEDQTQDRGHPPSRNDQVPEWRGYKRDPRRDQRYPDDPREAAGAYWIGPEDWA
ncbi:uncharacterized protein LOC143300681 [Babylonia areolata]|uniref:uncharacterized protein LOC143300681 n=1 Tax=Babylonia areolata TaxID=304850 RepID=UPI003FCF6FBF